MQRDYIVSLGLREANAKAKGAVLSVPGLHWAKKLNPSVVEAKEAVSSLQERSWWVTVVRTVPNRARPRRRQWLSSISSREIWISGEAALPIGVGESRHWQRGF